MMATKTSPAMDDLMRNRRRQMADTAYGGPPTAAPEPTNDTDMATESTEKFTVAAPGEPGTSDQFEYEPFVDTPGAWVVYPPGVPCDDTEYRIQMPQAAQPDDFAEMQKALDDAGATNPEPAAGGTADMVGDLGTNQPRS
jgi:hypothetical protein